MLNKQIATKNEMITLIRENKEQLKNIVESFKVADLNKLSFNNLRQVCSGIEEVNIFAGEIDPEQLKNRIEKLVRDKAQFSGKMGTEQVRVTFCMTEEEVPQLDTLEMNNCYSWELEDANLLHVIYVEDGINGR